MILLFVLLLIKGFVRLFKLESNKDIQEYTVGPKILNSKKFRRLLQGNR
jgi:hypothetical protein